MLMTRHFIYQAAGKYGITIDDRIIGLLQADAVVAGGVSGGKDSDTFVLKLWRFFNEIGFTGVFILVHAHLGAIEHADSLPQCERLAAHVGKPLIVVFPLRPMIERWYKRWADNCFRYINLSTVKLVTPWSTQAWRFCTAEEKVAPIISYLKRSFPGRAIINATGIRGEESPDRKKKPISKFNKTESAPTKGTLLYDWYPIRDVLIEEVRLTHWREKFREHECYAKNGNTRCSCVVCILAGIREIQASMRDERNHDQYRRVVNLEIESAYSFSQSYWLGDACPELLESETLMALSEAKEKHGERQMIEAQIPEDLLYVKADWPKRQFTYAESALLAGVRRRIGKLMSLPVMYVTRRAVYDRCAELLALKEKKKLEKKSKNGNSTHL